MFIFRIHFVQNQATLAAGTEMFVSKAEAEEQEVKQLGTQKLEQIESLSQQF